MGYLTSLARSVLSPIGEPVTALIADRARDIEINTREARRIVQRLVEFLGTSAVNSQLHRIDAEFQTEKPNPHYRKYWLEPRRAWWLGLQEALRLDRDGLSLRHRISPTIEVLLHSARKLSLLLPGMPPWKRDEYRSRLLGDPDPTAVLFELDVAAHYVLDGDRIEWVESGHTEGRRTPEFVAAGRSGDIEIECRAKSINAGRKVWRENFYRLFDEIDGPLVEAGASGWIDIVTADKMPGKPDWRNEVRRAVLDESAWASGGKRLTDGTYVGLALRAGGDVRLRPQDLQAEAQRLLHEVPFPHVAVIAPAPDGKPVNPVFVRARSETPDRILRPIFDDLRSKKDQFTGHRAAILCCHVPEVESFESLRTGKLANMTLDFFLRHAGPHIAGVVYSSDSKIVTQRTPTGTTRHRLTDTMNFPNPNYDADRYGRIQLPGGTR